MSIVTRFAPSPTGYLHLGHAYSAWLSWRAAEDAGGRFILRIEDIDQTRCRPDYTRAIFDDLAWLGLVWEPDVRHQSQHFDDYQAALDQLSGRGLVYPCFCTRKDIQAEIAEAGGAPQGPDGPIYPGTCRHLSPDQRAERIDSGEGFALRLDMAAAIDQAGPLDWLDLDAGRQPMRACRFGDVVIARKDTPTSYHLSVTVDDGLQGVTLVTRGVDLFEATHVHRLLQALLGLPTPEYRHHRLLTDADGRRYAKRDKSLTIRALKEAGKSPAEVVAMAGIAP